MFGVCSAFTFVDLWHKRDFLDQVPYLTGTWGNTLPPGLGPLHCFNTALNACLVFSDLRVNSTFLTSACDIVQICLSHTPYLGRGSGLSSVTFVFVIRRTVDPRLQKSHAHTQIHITGPVFAYTPQSSPAFITTQDKHCDNKGLVWLFFQNCLPRLLTYHTLTPAFIRPLSKATCYSNTHLPYSLLIWSFPRPQQVGLFPQQFGICHSERQMEA